MTVLYNQKGELVLDTENYQERLKVTSEKLIAMFRARFANVLPSEPISYADLAQDIREGKVPFVAIDSYPGDLHDRR